jgi:hypothetical protein
MYKNARLLFQATIVWGVRESPVSRDFYILDTGVGREHHEKQV